ncbi:MAG: pentapeptide repeat-containing protein [Streptosporangiaceae bacterium]
MSPRTRPAEQSWAPRLEVTSWPFDQRARQRLTQFRQERMRSLDVIFWGADLDLRGAHLCGFDFSRAAFNGAVLDKVRMLGANLSGVALSGASLEHADLTGCVLVKADLSYCRGRGAVLAWARLSRAEIYDADLREADLIGAELDGAAFAGSDLRGARLQGVRFSGTSLGRARLADCLLADARGSVLGPVDVSKTDEPELLDGEELLAWFRDRRAAHVTLSRRAA